MNCFNHSDRNAVCTCKSCQRGLCHECAVDLGKGLACKERCEEDVRQLITLIDQGVRNRPTTNYILIQARKTRIVAASFYILMGIAFIGWGFSRPFMHFIALLGVLFVVYGTYFLLQLPKAPKLPAPKSEQDI